MNRVDGVAACRCDIAHPPRGGSRRGGARIGDVEGVVVERIPGDVISVDQNPPDTGRRLRQPQYCSQSLGPALVEPTSPPALNGHWTGA